jgi:hypothetical protein
VSYAVNLPTPTTCPDDELRPIQALSQAPTLAPILGVNAEADPSAICPVDAGAVMVREALAAIPSGSSFASDDLSFLLGAPIFAAQRLTARLKILPRRETALSVFRKMARMAKPGRPLAGFIFSRDQKVIDRFIGELSFGGGGVNLVNVHLFVETMPFGGTGSAGMGHYYGKFGFDALTHAKSILISPPDVAIDHLYSPFTDEKNRALQGWFEY